MLPVVFVSCKSARLMPNNFNALVADSIPLRLPEQIFHIAMEEILLPYGWEGALCGTVMAAAPP